MLNITQIPAPRVELLDPRTGLMSREWFRFFNNIYTIVGANLGVIQIVNGGTGLSTLPTNGQLLIGNTTTGEYVLNTIATALGVSVTNGAGTITLSNTGVLSNVGGLGISVSSATGDVTITNTGVLSTIAGTGISVTGATGNVTIANTGVLSVSGTAPVVSSGGATPAISMPAATTAVNGYLTSTDWNTFNNKGSGTVTTVGFTGGVISVATPTTTPALTIAGTSGGIPYFSSATTWASSAVLAANSLVQGGGAGVAPSTITTGTGVITALGVNTGAAGSFVVYNNGLGTPSSGVVTNLTGTASININGTVGATTPTTGAFTALSATSNAVGSVTAKSAGLTAVTAVAGSLTLATGGVTLATQVMAAASVWRVVAYGTYAASSSANVRALTMACYWNSTKLTSVTSGNVLAVTAQTTAWRVEIEVNGSSATAAWCTGILSSQVTSATIPLNYIATAASVTGLTTTSTLDFRVGQTGTATAGDTINVHTVVIERIK